MPAELEAAKHVEEAQQYLAEMKRLVGEIKDENILKVKLSELYLLITARKEALAETPHEQYKKRIAEIDEEAKSIIGPRVTVAISRQARAHLEMAKLQFHSEQYNRIEEQKRKLEKMLTLAEVRQNPDLEKEIKNYLLETTELIRRGVIRQNFAARKLRVSGIIYTGRQDYETVSFTINLLGKALKSEVKIPRWVSESVAVVAVGAAEEEVKEGDRVKLVKDAEVFVQRIDPDAVIFLYEGESIRVPQSW